MSYCLNLGMAVSCRMLRIMSVTSAQHYMKCRFTQWKTSQPTLATTTRVPGSSMMAGDGRRCLSTSSCLYIRSFSYRDKNKNSSTRCSHVDDKEREQSKEIGPYVRANRLDYHPVNVPHDEVYVKVKNKAKEWQIWNKMVMNPRSYGPVRRKPPLVLEGIKIQHVILLMDLILEWPQMSKHVLIILDAQYTLRREAEKNIDVRFRFNDLVVHHGVEKYYPDAIYYFHCEKEAIKPDLNESWGGGYCDVFVCCDYTMFAGFLQNYPRPKRIWEYWKRPKNYQVLESCIIDREYVTDTPCCLCLDWTVGPFIGPEYREDDENLAIPCLNHNLIKQFIDKKTGQLLPYHMTGLCLLKQRNLHLALLIAWRHWRIYKPQADERDYIQHAPMKNWHKLGWLWFHQDWETTQKMDLELKEAILNKAEEVKQEKIKRDKEEKGFSRKNVDMGGNPNPPENDGEFAYDPKKVWGDPAETWAAKEPGERGLHDIGEIQHLEENHPGYWDMPEGMPLNDPDALKKWTAEQHKKDKEEDKEMRDRMRDRDPNTDTDSGPNTDTDSGFKEEKKETVKKKPTFDFGS